MKVEKGRLSRRRFLGGVGMGFAVPTLIASRAVGGAEQRPPSERVVAALVGCGGR